MDFTIAKIIHVIGVVLWIGGVSFVTIILIPAILSSSSHIDKYGIFEMLEHRFAQMAKIFTFMTGLSGFYLVHTLGAWDRFFHIEFWWMHLMFVVWLIFTLILFILEPLFLHNYVSEMAKKDSFGTLKKVFYLHCVLLFLSLITIVGVLFATH